MESYEQVRVIEICSPGPSQWGIKFGDAPNLIERLQSIAMVKLAKSKGAGNNQPGLPVDNDWVFYLEKEAAVMNISALPVQTLLPRLIMVNVDLQASHDNCHVIATTFTDAAPALTFFNELRGREDVLSQIFCLGARLDPRGWQICLGSGTEEQSKALELLFPNRKWEYDVEEIGRDDKLLNWSNDHLEGSWRLELIDDHAKGHLVVPLSSPEDLLKFKVIYGSPFGHAWRLSPWTQVKTKSLKMTELIFPVSKEVELRAMLTFPVSKAVIYLLAIPQWHSSGKDFPPR